MNHEMEYQAGCSEEFAELCALSTSGELSAEELAALDEHVAGCVACTALLREYRSIAQIGMAKLAAELAPEPGTPLGYNETKAEARFVVALEASHSQFRSRLGGRFHNWFVAQYWDRNRHAVLAIGTAAALLICVGSAFELGRKVEGSRPQVPQKAAGASSATASDAEEKKLKADLVSAQAALAKITAESSKAERQVEELSSLKTSLMAQIADLAKTNDADSASLVAVTQQRDSLQQQLSDTSNALIRTRDELDRAQEDRHGALLRVATLETEVKDLNTELSAINTSASNDEKFLAADRDIRELMGARQLFIADVWDVQHNGERSKPFGRVFYTKGKSLMFYAFDLPKQPGYRETKAFQAWGKSDSPSGKPISLGIFYEDSEQNRRWVVKSDNPEVIDKINSVFVTVEPRGGSEMPTTKAFLETTLHSLPPNHP